MKYDELLGEIGEFGTYQKIQYVLVNIIAITSAFHSMNMVFVGPTPEHRCALQRETPEEWRNLTNDQVQNLIYPYSDGERSSCEMYNITGIDYSRGDYEAWLNKTRSREVSNCPAGWIYSNQYYETTIVSEWDLVCDDTWLRSMASTIFFAGRLVGALLAGQLSDLVGRRPVFFVSTIFQVIIGCSAAFSPNVPVFYTLYFLQGVLQVAVFLSGYVLGAELVGPKYRKFVGFSNNIFYALGQMIFAGIAYWIRQWRYIEIAISAVSILYLSYYWFMSESVRWLMSRGRREEAEKIIMKAAKTNKTTISKETLDSLDIEEKPEKRYSFIDILKRWRFAKVALNVWFNWFANALVYYGLNINTSNLAGDPYLNFFIAACVEIPSVILTILVIDKLGRRWLFFIFMMLSGVTCIGTAFVPDDLAWLATTLSMIGKFGVTASYAIIYLMAAEVFPTVVRNVGMGTSSMCARIGGMVAPQILLVGDYIKPLPLIIFGVISLVGGGLGLLLPETTGKPLAQDFDEAESESLSGISQTTNDEIQNEKSKETSSAEDKGYFRDNISVYTRGIDNEMFEPDKEELSVKF